MNRCTTCNARTERSFSWGTCPDCRAKFDSGHSVSNFRGLRCWFLNGQPVEEVSPHQRGSLAYILEQERKAS